MDYGFRNCARKSFHPCGWTDPHHDQANPDRNGREVDLEELPIMPTDLGKPYEITWRGDPQQMLPPDVPLWHRFLDRFAFDFLRFYYNVRVGGPDLTNVIADESMKKMWYASTAKRIDAIGERKNDIWIIEVASSPYLRAVGQCLTYRFLWNLDPKIDKPVRDILLCPHLDHDLEMVLKHYGVMIITL